MADYYINVFLNDESKKLIEEAGLGSEVKPVGGKTCVQIGMDKKDQKKLLKSFPDLQFDSSNACVLPEQAENTLIGIVKDMKTLDVMKIAIMKLFNPLAGKDLRSRLH
jgi:hypothetical protein